MSLFDCATSARAASISLAAMASSDKDAALEAIARELEARAKTIFKANEADLAQAEREGLARPLVKRLAFDEKKLVESIAGIRSLIAHPDPVGRSLERRKLDDGLVLERRSCPIGLIGVIFESRPDALVQISCLCLKSGNAVILKGGREAARTNRALFDAIAESSSRAGLPPGWIGLIETREEVREMLELDDYIDLIIPRGSNEFVQYIMRNSSIPVMGHSDGVCHLYVDSKADLNMAVRLAKDSKTQYVAVCNALECLLVDAPVAATLLPMIKEAMPEVELRGCERTRAIVECKPAIDEDWGSEYLDYIMAVKVVDGLDQAIAHINRYGSRHTDAICTSDPERAARFFAQVDSADVFWNASTRFADGYKYGLGAEVGISTSKLHARGPVGLEGLVIYKWLLSGSGHVYADYAEGKRNFKHEDLP